MPRPLDHQKAADFSSNFFGITPAPQYSLNLTTRSPTVKSRSDVQPSLVQCPKSEITSGSVTLDFGRWTLLFNFDGCARIGKLLPHGLSFFFRDAFLHRLWRRFDEVLGFFQAKRRHFAHNLNDVDLVAADGLQDHVKLGLLFSRSRGFATAATSSRSRHCCRCRRNAESFLQLFHELRSLQQSHALQKLNNIFTCCCHDCLSILLKGFFCCCLFVRFAAGEPTGLFQVAASQLEKPSEASEISIFI